MMNDVIKFYFSIHVNEVLDFNEPKYFQDIKK